MKEKHNLNKTFSGNGKHIESNVYEFILFYFHSTQTLRIQSNSDWPNVDNISPLSE